MNLEERNVMAIVNLSRLVENSLKYVEHPEDPSFSEEEREAVLKALKGLSSKGTPFYENCARNGDFGKELMRDMLYFIDDVYGKNGRIVSVDLNNKVHVESSLQTELFTTIVKLHARLEIFIDKGLEYLQSKGLLDESVRTLVQDDKRFYHSYAGKLSAILLANKANEGNQTMAMIAEGYSKQHGGANPNRDPEFHPEQDPSMRMIRNEFHEINEDMVLVLNTYGDHDPDFQFARDQTYSDCDIFNGKKQTSDPQAFFQMFVSYFDPIISSMRGKVNLDFQKVEDEIAQFDQTYLAQLKKAQEEKKEQAAKPEEPAKEEK
jgi:hypothetical protein